MNTALYTTVITIALISVAPGQSCGSKILMWPMSIGPRSWLTNMMTLAQYLQDSGHKVTLLTPNTGKQSGHFVFSEKIIYNTPLSTADTYDNLELNTWTGMLSYFNKLAVDHLVSCKQVLEDPQNIYNKIQSENFDLIIYDIHEHCAAIFMDALGIPAVKWSNYGAPFYKDVFFPHFPSYVHSTETFQCTSTDMDFWSRFLNFLEVGYTQYYVIPNWMSQFDILRENYLGSNLTLSVSTSQQRSITMTMLDFSITEPRPLMPHVIPLPYLFKKEPKSISLELDTFMHQSGRNGVIFISYENINDKNNDRIENLFIKVFTNMKQHVVWNSGGFTGKTLPYNIKVLDGVSPGNILSHPAVRLVITDTNSMIMFEAISYGVPVIATPRFADQCQNAAALVLKAKMGIIQDYYTMTEDTLSKGIKQVIGSRRIATNAQKAKLLMDDQMIDPKAKFLWWIQHVIKHKGATYLISEAAFDLHLTQYLLLDIFAIICMFAFICMYVIYGLSRVLCALIRRPISKPKRD